MSQLFWCDTLLQVRTWWLFTDYGANPSVQRRYKNEPLYRTEESAT
ncbi:hypothetical protein DRE43_24755 [Salmonella enterica subsp. enterica serovar Java]|uniref:Uncharacterized protein n=2 Tax=Salmonella enterica TaxID=28901 RepID=A0A743TXH4_SALER|nr:hypothetical protein [Salmonella enterica]EAW1164540.1 hypothetical protein [Salmonella enterica subsp. enterica]EBS2696353.1 hypothetical protein [Salmonella enterica subsp. enterica serovar Newport]EBS2909002.1 hypothetical protein [Salmonella enterica subsp. enterica serovar Flottbek]EBV8365929.1 hypothetical protein [Salmonella enterica subsp. enterica serovar Java]EBV8394848.1 hypothetical protein [Salmonella enterica subsp. enterica serovar Virchow]ECA4570225.1 hypothetical protein [